MHSFVTLLPSLLLAAGAAAQHVHLDIPQVDHAVSLALSKAANYTGYRGPTGTAAVAKPTTESHAIEAAVSDPAYWLADITHQGIAAFNAAPSSYQVFRNVKDFGAKGKSSFTCPISSTELSHRKCSGLDLEQAFPVKLVELTLPAGDGVTDDTAAINSAISSGGRCAPGSCESSTTTPAIVYFPAGTYIVSTPIIDYYYTQIIGNPNGLPTIKASAGFSGAAVIDADPYQNTGNQGYGSTDVFYRQIRNIIIDTTSIAASSAATGLHWPTAQATSLQNVQVNLNQASGTQHVGIFIENGK